MRIAVGPADCGSPLTPPPRHARPPAPAAVDQPDGHRRDETSRASDVKRRDVSLQSGARKARAVGCDGGADHVGGEAVQEDGRSEAAAATKRAMRVIKRNSGRGKGDRRFTKGGFSKVSP